LGTFTVANFVSSPLEVFLPLMLKFCIGQLFNPYLLRVEDKAMLDEMAARAEAEPA